MSDEPRVAVDREPDDADQPSPTPTGPDAKEQR